MESCFFDATTVDPLMSSFEPLPEGEYEAMIIKSENKLTKAGTGSYLELQVQVISGEYKKRILWAKLNLKNPSTGAVERAKRELSSICHAVGVLRPQTKEALHNIPMIVRVIQVDDERNPGKKDNKITAWIAKPDAGVTVSAPAPQPVVQTQQAPIGAGEKPW